MFGIEDPWIWTGYVACFVTVAFSCVYGWMHRNDGGEE